MRRTIPSNLMPTSRHFWNRQQGHLFRCVLSILHSWFSAQVYLFLFWTVLLKKPWRKYLSYIRLMSHKTHKHKKKRKLKKGIITNENTLQLSHVRSPQWYPETLSPQTGHNSSKSASQVQSITFKGTPSQRIKSRVKKNGDAGM